MAQGNPRVDRLKRMLYLIILPISASGAFAVVLVRQAPDSPLPLDRIQAPAGGILTLALWLLLLLRPGSLRLVERLAVLALSGGLLAKYLYMLGHQSGLAELAGFLPWLAVGYLGPYLVLDTWWAVLTSFGFLAFTVVIGLLYAIPLFMNRQDVQLLQILAQSILANGVVVGVMIMYTRLRDQFVRTQAMVAAMSEIAHTDFLTELSNRRQLYEVLNRQMDQPGQAQRPVSLILIDVDHFKMINDTYGHDVGDQVLKEFATLIKRSLRGTDHLGRWGGEEFLVIAPDTDLAQAELLAGRLQETLRGTPLLADRNVTASFGVAALAPGDTLESWIKRADEALYRAKQGGRDRVETAQSA